MKLTNSVSFWILIFSLLIGCLIGSFTHWIVGTIIFLLLAGKSAIYGLVMDTISGSLEYHHDREDARAKKKMESMAFLKYGDQGKNKNSNPKVFETGTYFKNGKRNGNGTVMLLDGTNYVGQWKDGKMNGQGTLTFWDGTKYVGQFKDGEYDGQGTLTWADGTKYVGQFKNGDYDGQGIITFEDGSMYIGQWKAGFMDGQGTLTGSDGSEYAGQWENGHYIGR